MIVNIRGKNMCYMCVPLERCSDGLVGVYNFSCSFKMPSKLWTYFGKTV